MNRNLLPRILALVVLTACTCSGNAQFAQRGSINGFVFDTSGAVIQNAQVTLLDVEHGQTEQTKTDGQGHFEFTNLAAGQYELTGAEKGFETAKSESITVHIGQSTLYNFRLNPGAETQSVTVTGESAALQTGQSDVDTNISQRQMEDLPLNGRNFTSVASLAPGVSTTPQPNINPGGTFAVGAQFASGGVAFTTGGSFEGSRDNGFYVNGVNITDNYESSISYEPSAEALAGGTLQVADFSAANGHDISSLAMQTRSGTTEFHGEAYDFLENDAMNAVNPFDKAESMLVLGTPAIKPTLRRNQFGGGLGGPVYVPHVPWLRNHLFFFANYEKFDESDGSEPVYTSVPSAAERTGDFSELLSGPNPLQLYNPFLTTYDANGFSSRPAIPGNRLDLATRPDGSSLVDPTSAALLSLYPLPDVPNTPSYMPNYATTEHLGFSTYHFDSRFDAHIGSRDTAFVTWSMSHGTNDNSGGVPPSELYLSNTDDKAYLVTANWAHVFTPDLTNEFIFGIGDGALQTLTPSEISYMNSDSNPLNKIFQNTGSGLTHGVLAVDVYNYASPGYNEVFRAENQTFQISDNLDWIRGRHTISAGMNYFRKGEYDWDFIRFVTFGEGSYNAGFPREEFSSGGYDQNYVGGDGMADLVMGVPQVSHQRFDFGGGNDPLAPELNVVFPYWGFYVNDKFQASPKLTISAGLRYDLNIPLYARNDLCCAVYSPTSDGGILKVPGIAPGLAQHYLSAQKIDFAPRVSIAYNPRPSLVLRAGYGIFYDAGATQISGALGNALNGIPGYFIGNEISNVTEGVPSDTPALSTSQVFQPAPSLAPGQYPVSTGPGEGYFGDGQEQPIYYYDNKSMELPYYQRILADVQQQLTPNDTLTLSYAGVQGRKGSNYVNINLPAYQTGWPTLNAFDAARPNNAGRFSDIYVQRPTLNSYYNAAIVQYQHRFVRGLEFLANYTWSKTISDYPLVNNLAANGASPGVSGFQYPNIPDRGEASLSHRHRFVYSGIWSPQYGGSWAPWARETLTGWRLSGIGTIESGNALTVVNTATTAADYAGFDELSVSGNPNLPRGSKTFFQQFDTSLFTAPPNGVRGNSGLGTVRGPGQNNVDLSLAKTFPIHERFHAEFRADAFNALNHTQWSGAQTVYPYATVGNYGNIPFGQVTGALEARIMQVALKLAF